MAINFYFEKRIELKRRKELKTALLSLFQKEKREISSLNYIFCSDEYLLKINKQFLDHDYYTDIISFDLSDPGQPAIGEIYISVERVIENADIQKGSIQQELHRVIFHGALHLCGYKDKTKDQQRVMRRREDYYLKKHFT